MEIIANRAFVKDLAEIPKEIRERIENFAFRQLPSIKSIKDLTNLEKLKGHRYYYRVRFGDYRVDINLKNNTLTLERVLHRKEIYKKYP